MESKMTMAARVQVAGSVAGNDWWGAEHFLRLETQEEHIYFTRPEGYQLNPGDHARLYVDNSLLVVKDGNGTAYASKDAYLACNYLTIVDDEESGHWLFVKEA